MIEAGVETSVYNNDSAEKLTYVLSILWYFHVNTQLDTYEKQAKKLVRSLALSTEDPRTRNEECVTVESGSYFCFHYVISDGIVILTLTEKAYPKRLAFDYLDELRKEFFQSYGNQIATASRPYEFIRFDTFIQKTKKVYNDSKTQRNLHKLNSELKDVHSIMTRNINDVISRGERLESKFERMTPFFYCFSCLILLVGCLPAMIAFNQKLGN